MRERSRGAANRKSGGLSKQLILCHFGNQLPAALWPGSSWKLTFLAHMQLLKDLAWTSLISECLLWPSAKRLLSERFSTS